MNDQPVLDAYHHTDLRKTRAAGSVDHSCGYRPGAAASSASCRDDEGRFTAQALRVPTLNVSAMDLSVYQVNSDTDVERRYNAALQTSLTVRHS